MTRQRKGSTDLPHMQLTIASVGQLQISLNMAVMVHGEHMISMMGQLRMRRAPCIVGCRLCKSSAYTVGHCRSSGVSPELHSVSSNACTDLQTSILYFGCGYAFILFCCLAVTFPVGVMHICHHHLCLGLLIVHLPQTKSIRLVSQCAYSTWQTGTDITHQADDVNCENATHCDHLETPSSCLQDRADQILECS